jgi:hypothetical protein
VDEALGAIPMTGSSLLSSCCLAASIVRQSSSRMPPVSALSGFQLQ